MLNIEAQDFSTEQVLPEKNGYTGRQTCYVPESDFDAFLEEGIDASRLYQIDGDAQRYDVTVQENEFIILQADASLRKTHLGRVHKGRVIPLTYSRVSPYGIKPRNAGQYFMQEALMQSAEEAPLVIIKGQAGTAKTFYSLAVGSRKSSTTRQANTGVSSSAGPTPSSTRISAFYPVTNRKRFRPSCGRSSIT